MVEPGALIQAIHCKVTQDDKILLQDKQDQKYILDGRYDPKEEYARLKEQIDNDRCYVVLIPNFSAVGNHPLVLGYDQKYFYHLREFLLSPATKKLPAAQINSLDLWKKRWREGATNWKKVRCIPADHHTELPFPFLWRQAVYLHGEAPWVMPAMQSVFTEGINTQTAVTFSAQTHFAPDYYYSPNMNKKVRKVPHQVPPSFYKPLPGFPVVLTGTLFSLQSKTEEKAIRIILHGFLQPDLAHFKFRKHVIQDADKAPYWDPLLPPNSRNSIQQALVQCDGYQVEGACACPNVAHFTQVHSTIAEVFSVYINQIVTFFLAAHTIRLITAAYGSLCYLHCNALKGKHAVTNGQQFYPRLSAWGVCHNWDDEVPIIHFFAKTLIARQNMKLWGDDDVKFLQARPGAVITEHSIKNIAAS